MLRTNQGAGQGGTGVPLTSCSVIVRVRYYRCQTNSNYQLPHLEGRSDLYFHFEMILVCRAAAQTLSTCRRLCEAHRRSCSSAAPSQSSESSETTLTKLSAHQLNIAVQSFAKRNILCQQNIIFYHLGSEGSSQSGEL